MRVLFVDDDAVLRRLGEHALGTIGGMSVATAPDGAEALSSVHRHLPDVILMDLMMPGMNGDEVLAVLQSSPETRNIPVVFLTGLDDKEQRNALLAAGAVGCLSKPFDPTSLATELLKLLGSVSASSAVRP